MTRCFRFFCGTAGAMLALTVTGCGSMSHLLGGKSGGTNGTRPGSSGALGSFVASVDVKQGSITFRSDKAATAGKARIAAQAYGPGDRLQLSGTASYSGGILTGSVQLVSNNTFPLNDARVVVTSISDTSVTVANADGASSVSGTNRPYWDH